MTAAASSLVATTSYDMLIGREWVGSSDGARFDSVNPFTGRAWATAPEATATDVDRAVQMARSALTGEWGAMTASQRAGLLRTLASRIQDNLEGLIATQVQENGRLEREVRVQTEALAGFFHYYAGQAESLVGHTLPAAGPGMFTYTVPVPVGVVAAVIPWNSPLALLVWKLAPALAAGNTLVVKPSETTPVSTLEFARVVEAAGFPAGVVNVVTGGRAVGQHLVAHRGVDRVAFTGSTQAGRAIAAAAGEALSSVSLELGGKSPNIVFPDADLDAALDGVYRGAFGGAGQSCFAGSRVLLHSEIYEEFRDRLTARVSALRLGDPMDSTTEVGPLANRAQRDKVLRYIDIGRAEGATILAGGAAPDDPSLSVGFFVEPTIFGDVDNSMQIAREEIFGPVVVLIRFDDEAEAVRIANDTTFGLAAGVWTNDLSRAHRLATQLRAGTVWINTYRNTGYAVPFGGMGDSGLGRENGPEAIRDYVQTKTVWIRTEATTPTTSPQPG